MNLPVRDILVDGLLNRPTGNQFLQFILREVIGLLY